MSNKTKQINNNEHVDGVTNSVQQTSAKTLGEEVANFFYDESNYFLSNGKRVDVQKWKNFIRSFFERINNDFFESFRTKDDLELIIVPIDISQIRAFSGAGIGEQLAKPKGFLEFPCLAIFYSSNYPDIFPPIEYAIFKSSVHLADHFKSFAFKKVHFEGEFKFDSNFAKQVPPEKGKRAEDIDFYLNFNECIFHKNQIFNNFFGSKGHIDFHKSIFKEDVDFSYSKLSNRIGFDGVKFEKNAYFQELNFSNPSFASSFDDESEKTLTNKLSFKNSIFKGSAFFTQNEEDGSRVEICLAKAVFENSVVFDLKFLECPDFSEAHFLKPFQIKETWRVNKQRIASNDESKFRFLKKYFAEQGNHFKERQYFGYEMMAREKKLDDEGGSDWLLFKAYKHLSDFGMSAFLPFSWLCFFCSVFFIISLFFGCDTWSGLTNSVVRTLNPLAKFECSAQIASDSFVFAPEYFLEIFRIENRPLVISSGLRIVSAFQSVINATLIFLFVLGIRNKFKIK